MEKKITKYYEWEGRTFTSNGMHLTCNNCNELWCKHIQFAMIKHLDSEWVWEGYEDHSWPAGTKMIAVPIFPTSRLWATVALKALDERPFVRLYEISEKSDEDLLAISYLHPGEGRNVIRTTLIDNTLGQIQPDAHCTSPSHKFREESIWQYNTNPENKMRTIEFWSLWRTGKCITCNSKSISGDFADDLVPTSDKESIWR